MGAEVVKVRLYSLYHFNCPVLRSFPVVLTLNAPDDTTQTPLAIPTKHPYNTQHSPPRQSVSHSAVLFRVGVRLAPESQGQV